MIEIKVFFWFLKAIFCGLFQVGNQRWRIAGKELISKPTFRLPDSAANDRLIGFKILKRVLINLSSKNYDFKKNDVLIFEASVANCKTTKEYVIWKKKYDVNLVTCCFRDELLMSKNKVRTYLYLIFLSILLIPITIICKNRVQIALIFSEFIEALNLINCISLVQPKILHFFNTSEKDANFLYLLLKEFSEMQIFKHPSPGALIAHNQNLMTDVIVLSSNYQVEEFNLKFKEIIFYKEIEIWPPEYSKKYLSDNYYITNKNEYKYLLGFYSHGGWLRRKTKLTNALFANPEDEEECLRIVAKYVNDNDLTLKIYLHPKEKKHIEEAKKYYQLFIDESKICYYDSNESSSIDFNSVKIGICAYSAILFERDNLGLEIIVWREKNKNFPLFSTSLYDNSFNNYNEFLTLLNKKINSI